MTLSHKVISRTHFEKTFGENSDKRQWFWRTENPNGEAIGAGGKGFNRLVGALNGLFAQQGCDDWDCDYMGMQGMPEDYQLEKLSSDHYVIAKKAESQ